MIVQTLYCIEYKDRVLSKHLNQLICNVVKYLYKLCHVNRDLLYFLVNLCHANAETEEEFY